LKGYHVSRRFGWDTHGVPIEYEIDKKLKLSELKLSARDAVKQMGIEKYNAECRSIVMTYSAEWRHTIERLGRWVDFDNDYKVPTYARLIPSVLTPLVDGHQFHGVLLVGV
jgi:isoleucyl-tRNA synthetase